MMQQRPCCKLLFACTVTLFFFFFLLFFTPSIDAFSDSLFARLQKRLQYLSKEPSLNGTTPSPSLSFSGNTSSSSGSTVTPSPPPPPQPLLIERVIKRLHRERELAFDQVIPEAKEVLKKMAKDGDLKDCYDDSINQAVRVNLFNRTLGDVVRHFFKLHQEVLEDGLLSTILHRIRALVNNIRFIGRATVKCVLEKKSGKNATRIGLTSLAAYTHEEFVKKFLNPIISGGAAPNRTSSGNSNGTRRSKRANDDGNWDAPECRIRVLPSRLPSSWDWRTYRVPGKSYSPVTAVRNQGTCSSCFVFAAVGAMETVYMLSPANVYNHQQTWFSEQALLNCVEGGCEGGWPKNVYLLATEDGLVPAHTSPYKPWVERCDHEHGGQPPIARPSAFCEKLHMSSDAELQALVYQYGPVVSAIHTTNEPLFQHLKGPWNRDCMSTDVDHAVLTVGYTPTHWIIKNSWNTAWGVDGYLILPRDNTNRCGIYFQGSAVQFKGGIIRGGTGGGVQQKQQQKQQNYYPRASDYSNGYDYERQYRSLFYN